MIFSSPRTPVKKIKNSTFVTLIISNFDIFVLLVEETRVPGENHQPVASQ